MIRIEIFERGGSGKVVDTVEVDDMAAFRLYWAKQANRADYGFRIVGGQSKPEQRRVPQVGRAT